MLAVVAVGIYLPARSRRGTLVLAIVTAGRHLAGRQGLGAMLTGGGTDPNSGPLLALLALSYWPLPARIGATPGPSAPSEWPEEAVAEDKHGSLYMFAGVMLVSPRPTAWPAW